MQAKFGVKFAKQAALIADGIAGSSIGHRKATRVHKNKKQYARKVKHCNSAFNANL